MKLSNCPKTLRRQRALTLQLAAAFRSLDRAEAAEQRARARLTRVFEQWSGGKSANREQARVMLEHAGLVEPKVLCAPCTEELQ